MGQAEGESDDSGPKRGGLLSGRPQICLPNEVRYKISEAAHYLSEVRDPLKRFRRDRVSRKAVRTISAKWSASPIMKNWTVVMSRCCLAGLTRSTPTDFLVALSPPNTTRVIHRVCQKLSSF